MSQDVCSMGVSGSISTSVVGISGGKHFVDLNCERIKLAKVLQDFGMKVASVAILCQDPRVFQAMESAGTPCPFEGKIGKEAAQMWDTYPTLRPDYEIYIANKQVKDEIDAKIEEEEEKKRIETKIQKEKENITKRDKDDESSDNVVDDSPIINVHE
jgi:hypothetical protein